MLDADSVALGVQVSRVKVHFKDARFSYEGLLSISRAGAGLFKWVAAMVNYHAVAKTVEPKRKKVAEAEKSLRAASKDLVQTQARTASAQCYFCNTLTAQMGAAVCMA